MTLLTWLASLFGSSLDLFARHGDEGADGDPDG